MKSAKFASAIAAAALVATPIAVQAAPMALERDSAPTVEGQQLGGGIGPAVIIIALAAAGMAFLLLTDDDDDDVPISA